jgi:hypothetical protein
MGTNAERQGSEGTDHSMVALGPAGGWRLTVPWRALIRGLVLCLVLAGWLAPGYGGLPVAAAGTTRYVAPTGSDSGDCSASAAPCKTIGYAISQAQGGDTISIAAGTYAEHLDIEKNLTLLGAGASTTAIDGSNSGTVVSIGIANTATVVTLSGLTVQHGNAASPGGGIVNAGTLTLASSTVSGNSTTTTSYPCGYCSGGGIYNTGTLTLTNNSTISGNRAPYGGGGGIDNWGPLTLTNSTVVSNTSTAGGGISNYAATMTLTNSTVAGNSVSNGNGGGIDNTGIDNDGHAATITLTNSTVAGNSVVGYSGGCGIVSSSGRVMLSNSILAGNTAWYGLDCYASLTSGGYNLLGIDDGVCSGLTNRVNGD